LSFRPPSENAARRAASASTTDRGRPLPHRLLPWSSVPYSVSPPAAAASNERAFHTRTPAPPGSLNLLALRSAASLLALFHARSAHGVRPSELCSSRAAVRRLRRLCPPVVETLLGPSRGPPSSSQAPKRRAKPDDPHDGLAIEAPPAFRALLHTRVRHSRPAFYTGPRAWLSWALSPPGCSPSPEWRRPSPRLPSWGWPERTTSRPNERPCRVLLTGEVGLPLLRLPTLLGFATF
jgi:hypothetical protein